MVIVSSPDNLYGSRLKRPVVTKKNLDGQDLEKMFGAATTWLAKAAVEVDALNVFPVPDGDTGTNMMLTMRSSIEEISRSGNGSASSVAQAIAKGALMGARGNSGVILSQMWRGLARALSSKKTVNGHELARGLQEASETAYSSLSNPVEGTILTVAREASEAALKKVSDGNGDVVSVLEATVLAARAAVANTPQLLPVLKEAGVVDAGGQGLYTILEGALLYLRGELDLIQSGKSIIIAGNIPASLKTEITDGEEVPYGFCTEFLIKGENLNPEEIKGYLLNRGESLIVVGDASMVRVHIHTLEPDSVVAYAETQGSIQNAAIRNMDEQHKYFLAMQKGAVPFDAISLVAVVGGDGLVNVFKDLGISAIIPAGQTMNPSTLDIIHAVEAAQTDTVIILPNNKNIILTAEQVQALTKKTVRVVPTETIPQGVTALISFSPEEDLDTNVSNMTTSMALVRTIEITRSTRNAVVNGVEVKEGHYIGLLDGKLRNAGADYSSVVCNILPQIDLSNISVITVYYGSDATVNMAEEVSRKIRELFPSFEVEIVFGGQRHYQFIISAE